MTELVEGMPVVMTTYPHPDGGTVTPPRQKQIVGRIEGFEGGVILMRTPHGTLWRVGLCWVKPADDDDLKRLAYWDESARQDRLLDALNDPTAREW